MPYFSFQKRKGYRSTPVKVELRYARRIPFRGSGVVVEIYCAGCGGVGSCHRNVSGSVPGINAIKNNGNVPFHKVSWQGDGLDNRVSGYVETCARSNDGVG